MIHHSFFSEPACFSFIGGNFLRQRNECKIPESGATSDEETEDGDFTVYECPGLAPVRSPIYSSERDDTHLRVFVFVAHLHHCHKSRHPRV